VLLLILSISRVRKLVRELFIGHMSLVCLSVSFQTFRRYAADYLYGADDPILIQALAPEFKPCWITVASGSSAVPNENTAIGDLATVVERNLHVSSVTNNLPTVTVRIGLFFFQNDHLLSLRVWCHIVAQHQKHGGFQQQQMYRYRQRRPMVRFRALTH
jgi:hypothetical protein